VTPVDDNVPYSSTGSIAVGVQLLPPALVITLSLPPFSIQLNVAECLLLLDELVAFVAK
jgi:hypothetical protein